MRSLLSKLLRQVTDELQEMGAKFAVVGGLAVAARTEPRFTQDVDVALSVADDEEAEAVIGGLIRAGYRPVAEFDQRRANRLATMRLAPPGGNWIDADEIVAPIDVICATCGIEPELVAAATDLLVARGLTLPTAQVPHLIAMKLLSESEARLKDRMDLQNLLGVALEDELARVPPLIDLMLERGYGREMDLHGKFEAFRDKWA